MEYMKNAIFIGIGATLIMDIWGLLLNRAFGVPSLNFSMVGRWIGHFPSGQFFHATIGTSTPIRNETLIGWCAHYIIGIIFAAGLLAIWGLNWVSAPSLLPALIVGLATLAAPFFFMQPGMGAGVAASRTPQPNIARLRSVMTHLVFGFGLFLSAKIFQYLN